jgi:hypothetical protein
MTKLEFLDKISDILVGLNTLESDLLGSLYDELMRDAGWRPGSELPPVDRNGNSKLMVVIDDNGLLNYAYFHSDNLAKFWVKAGDWNMQQPILSVKWWGCPPKED